MVKKLMSIHFREFFFVALVIISVLTITFYDVVFQGKTFKVTNDVPQAVTTGVYGQDQNKPPFHLTVGVDHAVQEEPLCEFIKQSLREGTIPLWNPHQALGHPLVAMLHLGMFFPLTYILYIFPQVIAFDLLILSRFFFAAFFTYLFMRELKFKPVVAAVAAVTFMLSGTLLLYQNVTANADIMIPVLLYALERLIQRPTPTRTVVAAVAAALMVLAGHPEHVFINSLFGLAYTVFRLFSLRNQVPMRRVCSVLFLAFLMAIGFSAFGLSSFLWNLNSEFWHSHYPGTGLMAEEIPYKIFSIIMPHFFQVSAMNSPGFHPIGWLGGYIGLVPVCLALISLGNCQRKGLNYFFAAVAFLVMAKAYGLPIVNSIGYLPVFDVIRFSLHTPAIVTFCFSVCAGMGVRTLLTGKRIVIKASVVAGVMAALITFALMNYQSEVSPLLSQKAVMLAFILLFLFLSVVLVVRFKIFPVRMTGLLILLLVWGELFFYIYRVKPDRFDSFPPVPYVNYLKTLDATSGRGRSYGQFWTFFPNVASAYEVDDLGIFDGLILKRFVNFVNNCLDSNHFYNDKACLTTLRNKPLLRVKHFLDLLNVKYLVFPSEALTTRFHIKSDDLELIYAREVNIYKRKGVLPRAFIVHQAIFVDSDDNYFYHMLQKCQAYFNKVAIIRHPPVAEIIQKDVDRRSFTNSTAHISQYSPNEVIVEANMDGPGFLVLGDMYHPEWKAYIDDQIPTEIYEAYGLVRAVFLPQGRHTVHFVFRPVSFYIGCLISAVSVICSLVLIFVGKRRSGGAFKGSR